MSEVINIKDMLRIAKRENNTKRPYLLVNPMQGKHIPVSPLKALGLFSQLAEIISKQYENEKLLLIGFAETATAIGAAVSVCLPKNCFYIQTTREYNPHWDCLYFSESHSHATEQKLVINLLKHKISEIDRIVFIEDEVTTGNTIRHLIEVLEKEVLEKELLKKKTIKYGIASLLNSMTPEIIKEFQEDNITINYIHQIPTMDYTAILEQYQYCSDEVFCDEAVVYNHMVLRHGGDTRCGVSAATYLEECKSLANAVINQLGNFKNESILVLGAEEFMFPPLYVAKMLEESFPSCIVSFHASTRSPILPSKTEGYPIFSRYKLCSLYDENRINYIYNLKAYDRMIIIHDSQKGSEKGTAQLCSAISKNHCKRIDIFKWQDAMESSYNSNDITLLLKDITGLVEPLPSEEREKRIQAGAHYSTMLPIEYKPSPKYIDAYNIALSDYAKATAEAVCRLGDMLYNEKGKNITLVSLARAGIPVGILLKRYLEKYGFSPTHYGISIIRGQGIDENALNYLLENHDPSSLQFVDGWIGKGAILGQLAEALKPYPNVSPELAVLSDPAKLTRLCGTHEDILIPSSCLNSTVSGLLSRTFFREDIIGKNDFHGACYYKELKNEDVSYDFIDAIAAYFDYNLPIVNEYTLGQSGMEEAKAIATHFSIGDINLIKPGIGEATRVLLRRVPWKLLIHNDGFTDSCLAHLLRLAEEKNVPVESYPLKNYKACGIIKTLADT